MSEPKNKSWLRVVNLASAPEAEIHINGIIGESFWDPEQASAKWFKSKIDEIPSGRKVKMFVNSQGGSVMDGLGIYNAIKARSEDFTAVITGYAMSIASFFPLAASKVISPKTAVWMLHPPWTYSEGNAKDMEKTAEMLRANERAMVAGYAEATGMSPESIQKLLEDETYLDGSQAVELGLADEMTDEPVTLSALDERVKSRLRNVPIALGAIRPPQKKQNEGNNMETNAAIAEPKPAAKSDEISTPQAAELLNRIAALSEENAKINAKLEAENKRRITEEVTAECVRIGQAGEIESWVTLAIANPAVIANLKKMATYDAGPDPVKGGHTVTGGTDAIAVRAELKTPKERHAFTMANYADIIRADASRRRGNPRAANTHSGLSTITGTLLSDAISTVLQQRCCALRAVARQFSEDPMKPLTPVVFKQVQAGGTAQTNATNFEDTTNFVGTTEPITITPARITSGAHVTAAELNSGLALNDFAEIKGAEFANAIMAKVAAVITTGNFTGTALVSSAAAFGGSDLKTLWGQLKLAFNKSLILDGEYYAALLPADRYAFNVDEGGTWPGWNGVFLNTVWTGATANTVGFALDPMRAIACVAGTPILPSNGNSPITERTFTVPGLEIPVSMQEWVSPAGKVSWMNLEVMFGAAKCDGAAGILIKSA